MRPACSQGAQHDALLSALEVCCAEELKGDPDDMGVFDAWYLNLG